MSNVKAKVELRNNFDHQRLANFIFLIIAAFLLFAPYAKGLFNSVAFEFERRTNFFFLFGSVLVFSAACIQFSNLRIQIKQHWIYYGVWILPIAYFLPYFGSYSKHSSLNSIFIYTILASLFVIGAFLVRRFEQWLAYTLLISGYSITFFGLFHWFGLSYYLDAVNQGRISSVFQYANTFAIFLACITLSSIYFLLIKSHNRYIIFIASFMTIPAFVSFFLTASRGALIMLPLIVLLLLLALTLKEQILFILYLGFIGIVTLILFPSIESIGHKVQQEFSYSQSFWGWTLLILCSLLVSAVILLCQRFLVPFIEARTATIQTRRWSPLYLPLTIVVLSILAIVVVMYLPGLLSWLPQSIQDNLANISFEQRSVVERFAFYRDAAKIFADNPIIGAGGGAWSSAFQAYQSEPYVSREAHSFYVQVLSESGIIGFSALVALVVYVFYKYIRGMLRQPTTLKYTVVFYIFALGILLHSLLDFNMSFAYISSIVFLSLGAMFGSVTSASGSDTTSSSNLVSKFRYTISIVLISVSLFVLVSSIRFIQGNYEFSSVKKELISGNGNFKVVMDDLNSALSNQSNYNEYRLMQLTVLNSVYQQSHNSQFYSQALDVANKILDIEPYNSLAYNHLIQFEKLSGNFANALDYANRAISLFPWNVSFYNESISVSYQLYLRSTTELEKEKYKSMINSTQEFVLKKQEEIKDIPEEQRQFIAFGFSPQVNEILDKM